MFLYIGLLLTVLAFGVMSCSKKDSEEAVKQDDSTAVEQSASEAQLAGENPLLSEFKTPFGVPPFDQIKPAHYLPAFKEGMAQQNKAIETILTNTEAPNFTNTIEAMDHSGIKLREIRNIFEAMRGSNTNDELQQIANDISPMLSKHEDEILLNAALFQKVKAVYEQKDQLSLTEEQAKLLEESYKAFVRGGANLDAEKKTRLKEINERLAVLGVKFGDNVLKETNRFELIIDNKEDLSGLTDSCISAAAETAEAKGHKGKWMFTLHKPSLIPFLQYSDRRDLREKMFKAYIETSNHNDELDNKEIIKEIVKLRAERAKLMGYKSHAHYTLEPNMAKEPEKVFELLNKLWKPSLELGKKEAIELQEMIKKLGGDFQLQPWDWWYYAEKLKKEKYDLDDELLRPYFKLENVRDGAFYLANQLYGIKFLERTDLPKYHPEVQTFEVQEADGTHIGILYMDFHPRDSKRGGAWMNNLRDQYVLDGRNVSPVVTNNGNFTRPTGDKPSLLNFDEVSTLFHEFGHGLHGLLSKCNYLGLSGTAVPIDFVELPSQIMENWVTEPELLKVYAKHYKTGEVIPQDLIEKIKKSALFNQGFTTIEYLAASLLDMDWHVLEAPGDIDVLQFETDAMNKINLIPEIVPRYRSTYFRHIFSSMYSAGYYSYIWAAVLDADAFEAFKETSLFDQKTAKAFRENILQKGGTADAMTLYKRFRGAEPDITPLLKRRGIL